MIFKEKKSSGMCGAILIIANLLLATIPLYSFALGDPGIDLPTPEGRAQMLEYENVRKQQQTTDQFTPKISCDIADIACGLLKIINWLLDALSEYPFRAGKALFYTMLTYNLGAFGEKEAQYGALLGATKLGWNVVAQVMNLFFVLILLWIAIATVFDFEPFTARSLLLRLIIAALLINFSFAIGTSIVKLGNEIGKIFFSVIEKHVGLDNAVQIIFNQEDIVIGIIRQTALSEEAAKKILDTEYIKVKTFFGLVPDSTFTAHQCHHFMRFRLPFQITIYDYSVYTLCEQLLAKADVARAVTRVYPQDVVERLLATTVVVKIFILPIGLFVLFASSIFLLIRLIALMMLIIFGPFAFFSLIFPQMRGYWTAWWTKLFQWSFYLPAFLFLYMISVLFIQSIGPLAGKTVVDGKEHFNEFIVIVTYFMGLAMMIASVLVANQMGIYGASTVTGWGKKLSGAAGGWTKNRGWKYGGKLTSAAMRIPGVGGVVGRIAPLRAGAATIIKKGEGVAKKDAEFYTKLPDKQLTSFLSRMSPAKRKAIWESLNEKRKRQWRASPELAQFDTDTYPPPGLAKTSRRVAGGIALGGRRGAEISYRALAERRGEGIPLTGRPAPRPPTAQTDAIRNQLIPIVQGLEAIRNLPEESIDAIAEGIERAITGLTPDTTAPVATRAIRDSIIKTSEARLTPGQALQVNMAVRDRVTQTSMEGAIQRALREVRPRLRQEFQERLDDMEDEVGGLREERGGG